MKYLFIAGVIVLILVLLWVFVPEIRAEEINDALISAIICVESGWQDDVVSPKGCIGLSQISLQVLEEYNREHFKATKQREHLFNSTVNIHIARWYLNRLKTHYLKEHYSLETLLGSYNWGIKNVQKVKYNYKRFPKSVKKYIRDVLYIYYEHYRY